MSTDTLVDRAPAGVDPEAPWRVGTGPVLWSTCTALVPLPQVCWDANGYYRELGVGWQAGRTELRRAYLALDGQRSARLTYVLSQLLDPEIRRRYDRTPLGKQYLDQYVQERVWANLLAEAGPRQDELRRLAARAHLDFVAVDSAGRPERLDSESLESNDGQAPPEQGSFPYGYYLWRARTPAAEVLETWQGLLARAATERGLVAQVAVGVVGDTPRMWVSTRVGYVEVIFLAEHVEPDPALAQEAITSLVSARTQDTGPRTQDRGDS